MSSLSDEARSKLIGMLERNPDVDWRAFNFRDASLCDRLAWGQDEQAELLPWLKAYQRLLRILPEAEDGRALRLLTAGLHSAIQIASLSRADFSRCWSELFPGEEELGRAVQDTARSRRSELLHQYIHDLQRNEPHYRSARFR